MIKRKIISGYIVRALQWRHGRRDDSLKWNIFSKACWGKLHRNYQISALLTLCAGNPPVDWPFVLDTHRWTDPLCWTPTGGFSAQRSSNAASDHLSWHHHRLTSRPYGPLGPGWGPADLPGHPTRWWGRVPEANLTCPHRKPGQCLSVQEGALAKASGGQDERFHSLRLQHKHCSDGVLSHRHIDCLFNNLLSLTTKKTYVLINRPFVRGIHWWQLEPPHQWLVMQKRFNASMMASHDDVIKWKHFPRYWPFVRGIHRSPVNSLHKGQWLAALIFTLICARINGWVNNREAGDLRCHRAHYDVIVIIMMTVRHALKILRAPFPNKSIVLPVEEIMLR